VSIISSVVAPTGWRSVPFGRVASRTKDIGRPDLQPLSVFLDAGVVPRHSREDNHNQLGEDLGKYLVVQPGDIVFNKLRTWQGGLGASSHEGIVSPAYFVCRPGPDYDSRFLQYLLLSDTYLQELTRVSKWQPPSQFDIGWEQLRAVPIVAPAVELQRAIAGYLDSETARIDALILRKLRMKELLEEREAAERDVIFLSVGAGSSCSLRWLLREAISDGPHETPDFVEDGVPFLSVDNIVDSQVVFDGCRMISEADHVRYCRKLRPGLGDVLITKAASVGKVALVEDGRDFNIWSPIAVLRTDHSVLLPEFLWQYLRTRMAQRELSLGSTSNTQQNISMRDLGSLRVPVVSIQDQRKACEQLSEEVRGLLNTIEDSVAVLRERRQALITAAVTGQIEVPQVAA
jgi:type I restriction enzyme S subunit